MVINSKLSYHFLLFSFFFLSLTFSLVVGEDDPELQLCKRQCSAQQEFTPQERRECQQMCDDYYKKKHGHGHGEGEGERDVRRSVQGQEQEKEQNPYVFEVEDRHYGISQQTSEGKVMILDKFHKRSQLLAAIANYRFLILEANPQSFVLPSHIDAESILYVVSGRGAIGLVSQGKRQSFNINEGDIVKISAGTTLYMINSDRDVKLRMAMLLQSVSLLGEFQAYYLSGRRPPSFFDAFSPELLATAFKADQDKIQRLISQRNTGVFVKASEQQIQSMTQGLQDGNYTSPFSKRPNLVFNILSKKPSISNAYGRLHEVDANDFQELQYTHVAMSYTNITKGAMQGPFFNSRSTKIAMVVKGDGYMEMTCPHIAAQQQEELQEPAAQRYQRISSPLKRGMLVVIPPGHATIIVAGNERSLEIASYEVNAENNWNEALAGYKNTVNEMENGAKELAFGVTAKEVNEVFGNQNEWFFFPGPGGAGA